MWINLTQLIRNRVADRSGNTLPVDLKTGTYELRDLSPGVGHLQVDGLALDDTFGFSAAPPPCPSCCPLVSIAFDSGFLVLPFGTTDPVGIVGINQCTGGSVALTPDFGRWGSDNVGIAKASYAKVQATVPGSTTVYAGGYVNGPGECECSPVFQQPTLPVTVQVPNSLSVLNVTVLPDGPGPPDGCPASLNYGIKIDIKYQVLDQNGEAIQSAGMTPYENGTFFTGGGYSGNIGPVPGYPTSSLTTAADGTFHDVPLGICQAYPIGSAGLTSLQHITIMMPDGSAPGVRTQTFTVTAPGSQSFGHGSISNSIGDISAKR